MPELSSTQIRAAAMHCASRAVQEGSPTGHFLSSARMFETYIRAGISQVGPKFKQGLILGKTGLVLRVEGDLSEGDAARIEEALTHILTGGPEDGQHP